MSVIPGTPAATPATQQPQRSSLLEEFSQFSQKLDLLLKPVAKRCRYALPVPAHLIHEEGVQMLDSLVATKHSGVGADNQSGAAPVPDALMVAKAMARDHCEGQLPTLNAWRARVRTARLSGEKCLAEVQQLTKHVQTIRDVTASVREQSDLLSSNASSLMVRKARLERVQAMLQESISQYNKVEDLAREAAHPMLSASSTRFSVMLEEIEEVTQFLANNAAHKSSKQYALKLALSQQRALQCLKDSLCSATNTAHNEVMDSVTYSAAFFDKNSASVARGLFATEPNKIQSEPVTLVVSESLASRGLKPALAVLNAALLQKLEDSAPLRRIAEARCASLQDDIHLQDLLATYRDARTRLVCPLLRDHLLKALGGIETADDSSTRLRSLTAICVSFTREVLDEERLLFEGLWMREDLGTELSRLSMEIGEEAYHIFRSNLLGVDSLDALAFAADALSGSLASEGTANGNEDVAALARRMSQDVQERVIFRTSVYIRNVIAPQGTSSDEARKALLTPPDAPIEIHPALKNCEYLLSTLYPTVEKSVFGVFAEETIHLTLTHLSRFIKSAAEANAVPHCALQARLLHLRHLLRLRAHISRFDASFVVIEKTLDLSQLVQRKLEILQSSREVKRDLESEMKVVCEDIVQLMGNAVLTGLRQLCSPAGAAGSPFKVDASVAAQASADAAGALEAMQTLLQRYIESAATRSVLMRPVAAQLADLQLTLKGVTAAVPPVAAPMSLTQDTEQHTPAEAISGI
jgi:hypothetical protein